MTGSELKRLRATVQLSQYQLSKEAKIDRTRISLAECDYVQLQPEECHRLVNACLASLSAQRAQLKAMLDHAEVFTQNLLANLSE